MSVTCQCGRPVDGATLCNGCTAALVADLQAVPDLAAELDVTLARQARFGERNGGRSAEKPLPYDVRASEAGWVLRNTLTTWARVIVEEWGQNGAQRHGDGLTAPGRYPGTSQDVMTAEMALWLTGHINHIRTHPAAGEASEEIRGAVQQARDAVDAPANRARIPIGPCPEPDCTGHLTAYIPAQPDRPAAMTCGQGHTWDTLHWRSIGRRVLAAQATA